MLRYFKGAYTFESLMDETWENYTLFLGSINTEDDEEDETPVYEVKDSDDIF